MFIVIVFLVIQYILICKIYNKHITIDNYIKDLYLSIDDIECELSNHNNSITDFEDFILNYSKTSIIEEEINEESESDICEESISEPIEVSTPTPTEPITYTYDEDVLTPSKGVNYYGNHKETYYNLDMSGVINIMRDLGYSEEEYPYWIRDDGCKMFGDYIIIAASLNNYPRGTIVKTSLGNGIVCDTGSFADSDPYQIDIAVTW